jgi:hypothetical protein
MSVRWPISGFERLVAWLCAGEVGAVLCFDASRLAGNGRDWHHPLELDRSFFCAIVKFRRPGRALAAMTDVEDLTTLTAAC